MRLTLEEWFKHPDTQLYLKDDRCYIHGFRLSEEEAQELEDMVRYAFINLPVKNCWQKQLQEKIIYKFDLEIRKRELNQ